MPGVTARQGESEDDALLKSTLEVEEERREEERPNTLLQAREERGYINITNFVAPNARLWETINMVKESLKKDGKKTKNFDSKKWSSLQPSSPTSSGDQNARQGESIDTLLKSTMEGDDNIVLIDVDSKMSANLKASNPTASGSSPFSHTPSPSNTRSNSTKSLVSDAEEDSGTLVEEIDSSVRAFKEKLWFYNKDKDMHVVELFAGNYGSIYKVPSKLRELNENAYTPRVVSIGPLHYGKPQLQAMERYKWMYLNRFLRRRCTTGIREVVVNDGMVLEDDVRTFYQDRFDNISRQEFLVMIVLDGIFIMELLMEKWSESSTVRSSTVSQQTEKIFDYPWMENDVQRDMMLLENQLPYVVLDHLFGRYYSKKVGKDIPLCKLIGLYFDNVSISSAFLPNDGSYCHLVDLLRKCNVLPASERELSSRKGKLENIRRATELLEAGVTFANATETWLLDIQFTDQRGVLTIPHLKVDEWTETFFRNLVAFEQCSRHEDQHIASYIILMSSIMRTPKDVGILVRHGIIENVRNSDVSSLFSNLRKEIAVDSADFFYANLCDKLNTYSKDRWHHFKGSWLRWKRMLRRDYFSNPWSIISIIAASILLSLTILQSVCSVLQVV